MDLEMVKKISESFLVGKVIGVNPISTGNINSTFLIETENGKKFILQKINKEVFKKPDEIMENITSVSRFLEKAVLMENGDPSREVLHPVGTLDGTCFSQDTDGEYWRIYDYIEEAKTYDTVNSPEMAEKLGQAFGRFFERLKEFDPTPLHEAIQDFHNTPSRFQDFQTAKRADNSGRIQKMKSLQERIKRDLPIEDEDKEYLEEGIRLLQAIKCLEAHDEDLSYIVAGLHREKDEPGKPKFPLRVTHNDTKINNVMIDNETGEARCVIDLDTVGPDSVLVDIGDMIRSACNRAGEEPRETEEASLDLELYEAAIRGYLSQAKGLTKSEIAGIYKAPRVIALELGMRFLTDYIDGDKYFKLKEGQPRNFNLHRAEVQFELAQDMEQKEKEMKEIVERIARENGIIGENEALYMQETEDIEQEIID